MNNKDTLLALGFDRFPDWDFENSGAEAFRLIKSGFVFRAHVVDCNGPVEYVTLGVVVSEDGKVKKWMDCVSDGSVERKIEREIGGQRKNFTI